MGTKMCWMAGILAVVSLCTSALAHTGSRTMVHYDSELPDTSTIKQTDEDSPLSNTFTTAFPDLSTQRLSTKKVNTELNNREKNVKEGIMAYCKPELRTVELDLPTEVNTVFFPSCVRLERCGGCCMNPRLTCRPNNTQTVTIKVLKTMSSQNGDGTHAQENNIIQPNHGRRKRQETAVQHDYYVNVTKHVECDCQCTVQEKDCNPAIQTYLKRDCACICKNKDEKQKCEQHDKKFWDNNKCACYCIDSVQCITGRIFSQNSCSCEKVR